MRQLTALIASLFVLGATACASIRPAPGPGARAAQRERAPLQEQGDDQDQPATTDAVADVRSDDQR
ncbi:MAG: hypothetical protein CVU56_13115 [Deltaproteobacteria bacterium HGW-Deltaproteobacteria-14]|jgi:hypothetical protein|nr:MAG: hypothetical protein CVU56_13115 [Deltaproteobacteria bacterium HGW-Deltaproteobacteria-14]